MHQLRAIACIAAIASLLGVGVAAAQYDTDKERAELTKAIPVDQTEKLD